MAAIELRNRRRVVSPPLISSTAIASSLLSSSTSSSPSQRWILYEQGQAMLNPNQEELIGAGELDLEENPEFENEYAEHGDGLIMSPTITTTATNASLTSSSPVGGEDRSMISILSTLSQRRNELLMEHCCFFVGSILGVMEGYLSLYVAKMDIRYPDREGDDFFAKPWLGPWSIPEFCYIVASILYLADAVIHLWLVDPESDPPAHRCSIIFFGIASLCDLTSAALDMKNEDNDNNVPFRDVAYSIFSFSAAYLYLCSALFNMVKGKSFFQHWNKHQKKTGQINKWRLWRTRNGKRVATFLGDVFFLIATLIDITIAHLDAVVVTLHGKLIKQSFNMLSSLLWFFDSLLYILADLIPTDNSSSQPLPTGEPASDENVPSPKSKNRISIFDSGNNNHDNDNDSSTISSNIGTSHKALLPQPNAVSLDSSNPDRMVREALLVDHDNNSNLSTLDSNIPQVNRGVMG